MYDVNNDEEMCIGCDECVEICQIEVFELPVEKSVPVNAEDCLGCECCIDVCKEDAINVEEI